MAFDCGAYPSSSRRVAVWALTQLDPTIARERLEPLRGHDEVLDLIPKP